MFTRTLQIELPIGQSCFLWGARKTGKTTLLKSQFPESFFLNLLDKNLEIQLAKSPNNLISILDALSDKQKILPIIIDEVQKIPGLLDIVHLLIEEKGYGFVLTGSSARKLKRGQANMLGGRAWRFSLFPLTSQEIGEDFDLLRALNQGLLPQHYLSAQWKRFLRAYVLDYLKEEIQGEALVRNLAAFAKFLDVFSFSNGELINYSSIASDCAIDSKTVKTYFEITFDTHLAYEVKPYVSKQRRDALSKTSKCYLFDVGVASFLQKRSISELKGAEAGKAFEHWVFLELLAFNTYREKHEEITFWRTKAGVEVDFIVGDILAAIEVKLKTNIRTEDLRNCVQFLESHDIEKAWVVSNEDRDRLVELKNSNGKMVHILSWKSFLQKLWNGEIF